MPYDAASFKAGFALGRILWRPPTVEKPKPPAHYLTFKSEDSSEFAISTFTHYKSWVGSLYYSTNGRTWSEWDGTTNLSSVGGVLHLRGSGNHRITGFYGSREVRWVLTSGKRIRCVGNIETLLDYETVAAGQHPQMYDFCFKEIFRDCTSLIEAPELPATTLSDYCYREMFFNCTSLTKAPALPATTLNARCYESMFHHCTSLEEAPELPATTMKAYCYSSMFSGCTSLAKVPRLPAMTLADHCYDGMFSSCDSLTEIPELLATRLQNYCYSSMFYGSDLIKLSTTQSDIYQYPYRIPTIGTGSTAAAALDNMFKYTGGSFKGTPSINTTYYTDHPPVPAG